MKIRFGPSGIPISCKYRNTLEGVKRIAQIGLDAMEISFTYGVRMSIDTARKIGEIAKRLDIELSIHAPYYINLASVDEDKIKASKKRIFDSLEKGNIMGASCVVAHLGYYGKDKERASDLVEDGCREISEKIKRNDWKTKFSIETMGKQKSWGTLEEVVKISRKFKNINPCIDFSHIYARKAGHVDFREIFDTLEDLKLKNIHTHFSGIKYSLSKLGKGNEIRHVPVKESGPDFRKLAKEILKRKLNITIISESPILEMDSLYMKDVFKRLGYKFT